MTTISSKLAISRQNGIRFSSTVMALTLLLIILHISTGFVIPSSLNTALSRDKLLQSHHRPRPQQLQTYMSKKTNDDDDNDDDEERNNKHLIHYNDFNEDDEKEDDCEDEREPVFCADARGRPAGVVLEDLNWRIEKLRLEEANKRRFLKAGPRFLPYTECQKWVQAWGNRWTSAEEWNDWIASGEKRNSYIPSRPEEYFTRIGGWVSWEHFLGVPEKDENSESH